METIAKIQKSITYCVSMILMYFLHSQKTNCPNFTQVGPFFIFKKIFYIFCI
jgi:hypothetical protein